jgi:hypothetical protein
VDWAGLAERIAADFAAGLVAARAAQPVTCEAQWRPRIPAADLAAHFGNE